MRRGCRVEDMTVAVHVVESGQQTTTVVDAMPEDAALAWSWLAWICAADYQVGFWWSEGAETLGSRDVSSTYIVV